MTVILAAVIMAIEKAKAISGSVLTTVAELFLIGYMVGAVGWAILFALRGSGVQRLSELRPSGGQRPGAGLSV